MTLNGDIMKSMFELCFPNARLLGQDLNEITEELTLEGDFFNSNMVKSRRYLSKIEELSSAVFNTLIMLNRDAKNSPVDYIPANEFFVGGRSVFSFDEMEKSGDFSLGKAGFFLEDVKNRLFLDKDYILMLGRLADDFLIKRKIPEERGKIFKRIVLPDIYMSRTSSQ